MTASTGAFVGINPENSEALRSLGTLFYEMPMPQNPAGVQEFTARQESDAAFISALAEAARGQVTGARTATEMAIIHSQMRTRLATREGHVHTALEDVGEKAFYLCRKYMKKEKMVRVAGNRKWETVSFESLQDVDVSFSMVGYNPIQQNPAVLTETLLQMIPFMAQNENIDMRRLTEEVINSLGLSQALLMPEDEALVAGQAEAAAEAQQSLGGAAVAEGGEIPPELAAILEAEAVAPEEALAAGGGAPIRGEA